MKKMIAVMSTLVLATGIAFAQMDEGMMMGEEDMGGAMGGMMGGCPECGSMGGGMMGGGMGGCPMMGRGGMGHMGGKGMMGMGIGKIYMMQQALNLTPDQIKKIEEIRVENEKNEIQLDSQIRIAHLELARIMQAENPDFKAAKDNVKKISDLQGQSKVAMIDTYEKALGVLTKEQRQQLNEMKAGMKGMMKGKMMQRGMGGKQAPRGGAQGGTPAPDQQPQPQQPPQQ